MFLKLPFLDASFKKSAEISIQNVYVVDESFHPHSPGHLPGSGDWQGQ